MCQALAPASEVDSPWTLLPFASPFDEPIDGTTEVYTVPPCMKDPEPLSEVLLDNDLLHHAVSDVLTPRSGSVTTQSNTCGPEARSNSTMFDSPARAPRFRPVRPTHVRLLRSRNRRSQRRMEASHGHALLWAVDRKMPAPVHPLRRAPPPPVAPSGSPGPSWKGLTTIDSFVLSTIAFNSSCSGCGTPNLSSDC
jgi:hypothetical protein